MSVDDSLGNVGQDQVAQDQVGQDNVGIRLTRSQSDTILVDSGDMVTELPNISLAGHMRSRGDSCSSSNTSESFVSDSELINYMNQMNLQLPGVYGINDTSTCSSVTDARSPQISSGSPEYPIHILFPSEEGDGVIKKPSPRNSDPVTIVDQSVLIQKSRLAELEYIEKNLNKIIALNLKNYIDSLSPGSPI